MPDQDLPQHIRTGIPGAANLLYPVRTLLKLRSTMMPKDEFQDRRAHQAYIRALRNMTPDERLQRAFELTELGIKLFRQGLRDANPHLSDEEFEKLARERLDKCHNRNY